MAAYESVLSGRRDSAKRQYVEMLDAEIAAYRSTHPAVVKAEADAKKAAEEKVAAAAKAKSGGGSSSAAALAAAARYSHLGHFSSMAASMAAMVGYPYPYSSSSSSSAIPDAAAMTGGSYDHVAGKYTPKGFKPSAALKRLEASHNAAKSAASSWLSVQPQTVFARGLGAMPRAAADSYAPETVAAAAASASSASSSSSSSAAYLAYGSGPDMLSIASCTEAAAKELIAALDKLTPPEEVE